MKTYKLGTRGSLLAVTQSTLMKNLIESLAPVKIELVLIKTQGDQITNKPLWQLEGKDFFTKELDDALLKGEVDFVVHSYKDLGSERPAGIQLAAITERKFAHDILLIRKDVIRELKDFKGDFVVGTSSPRRIVNLTNHLGKFIPFAKKNQLKIKCETLRGNVNTRIQKLKDGQYHAITLALAGLERLALGEKSREELKTLINGLNYFVLPQSVFPSAASQGALGIEVAKERNDQGELLNLLRKLSCEKTIQEVTREREAFKSYGGGCHLAVGIHVKKIHNQQFIHIHQGEVDGVKIHKKWIENSKIPEMKFKHLFLGLEKTPGHILADEFLEKVPFKTKHDFSKNQVFVTSRYCLETLKNSSNPLSIWSAGSKTAALIAEQGFWVNGTADSLGTEDLKVFQTSKALNLFHDLSSNWISLTHEYGSSDLGEVVACYERREKEIDPNWREKLKAVEACFWTSFPQFKSYTEKFSFLKNAEHFCGMGKTYQEFLKHNIKVHPLLSMEDFYELYKE